MEIYQLLNQSKEYLKGKKALVFDMDGTLIDSMEYWRKPFENFNDQINYMFEKYNTIIQPKESAIEFLSFLKESKVPVAIASDTPKKLAVGFINRFDFESYADFYVGSDDVGVYKFRSPAIYHKAAELLGVKPEECVVFEDNYTSVLSALQSGMTVVGVYDKQNEQYKDEIKSLCVDYIYSMKEMMK